MEAVIDSLGGMEKQFRSMTCERRLFDWMKKHSYNDNLHLRYRITVHIKLEYALALLTEGGTHEPAS